MGAIPRPVRPTDPRLVPGTPPRLPRSRPVTGHSKTRTPVKGRVTPTTTPAVPLPSPSLPTATCAAQAARCCHGPPLSVLSLQAAPPPELAVVLPVAVALAVAVAVAVHGLVCVAAALLRCPRYVAGPPSGAVPRASHHALVHQHSAKPGQPCPPETLPSRSRHSPTARTDSTRAITLTQKQNASRTLSRALTKPAPPTVQHPDRTQPRSRSTHANSHTPTNHREKHAAHPPLRTTQTTPDRTDEKLSHRTDEIHSPPPHQTHRDQPPPKHQTEPRRNSRNSTRPRTPPPTPSLTPVPTRTQPAPTHHHPTHSPDPVQ